LKSTFFRALFVRAHYRACKASAKKYLSGEIRQKDPKALDFREMVRFGFGVANADGWQRI
jgi:hypothetical protein